MRIGLKRLAVTAALVAGGVTLAAAPAAAAPTPWTRVGFYSTYGLCSADGVLAVRGKYHEYDCRYAGLAGYELWVR